MHTERSPKLFDHLVITPTGDELLVLDETRSQIHQLNASAAWVLQACDGHTCVDDIQTGYAAHFGLDETTAQEDVAAIVARFIEHALLPGE